MKHTRPPAWLRRRSNQPRCVQAWILVAFLACTGSGLGQEFGQGAVLLKETDRVLMGRVLQRAGFYEIELATNSRVSIPTDKVTHVAGSLLELYQFKRSSMSQTSIGDHFQLTRWCLSNGLLPQAAEHYAFVAQRNPNHPRVKQLGVELEEQLLRDEDFRQYLGLAPLSPAKSETKSSLIGANNATTSTAVVTAGAFEGGSTQHPEIAQRFTQRVEPILLSRCSQAACHGVRGTSALRLLEPYGRTHARTTSDNLSSVLKQINATTTELSPLLQYATRAHGTQPAPAIPLTDTRLVHELQDWIGFVQHPVVAALVTEPSFGRYPLATPEGVSNQSANTDLGLVLDELREAGLNPVVPGGTPLRAVPQVEGLSSAAGTQVATPFPASGFPVGTQPPSVAELDALDAQLKAALGEKGPDKDGSAPLDPFDPREFNRKTRSQH